MSREQNQSNHDKIKSLTQLQIDLIASLILIEIMILIMILVANFMILDNDKNPSLASCLVTGIAIPVFHNSLVCRG